MKRLFYGFLAILILGFSMNHCCGQDYIFRYQAGTCGADVFSSDGSSFTGDGCWTTAGVNFGSDGWQIGDFNGDGKDDIFRYQAGTCGADVFLSDGSSFTGDGCWTTAGVNLANGGWHIGDFNGDGKDDIFRYQAGTCGADVFLSDGSSFTGDGCWTSAGVNFGSDGWHIGDFNGDGKDDIFRYQAGTCGADVFLSDGSSFTGDGCWSTAGVNLANGGWHIGDFNGDGKDDIFRYQAGTCGADVFLSDGSSFTGDGCWTSAGVNFDNGGWHIGNFKGAVINSSNSLFKENIDIYPNPASDIINVNVNLRQENGLILRVSSVIGETIYHADLGKSNTIDLSDEPNGIYIIEIIEFHTGLRMTAKVFKLK